LCAEVRAPGLPAADGLQLLAAVPRAFPEEDEAFGSGFRGGGGRAGVSVAAGFAAAGVRAGVGNRRWQSKVRS
jgi:nitrate/nitrite transporter NarK